MTVTTLPTALAGERVTPELAARLIEAVTPVPSPTRTPDVVYVPAPDGAPTDAPRVFTAINSVMRDAMPVGKTQENKQQNYNFRGIDDVMSAMAGPMRAHGVFILPTIAEHTQTRDGKMTRTLITMRYRVYGPAGDCLVADVPGEAFDFADKSTNKAQSAALKYLLFTLFMLPVDGRSIDDGDRHHPEPTPEHRAEQQQRQQGRQQRGQGQQRQQQPRRSSRAEAGPWEQPPAEQQPQRRDYRAEAKAAPSPEAFAKVRAAAVKAGAPPEFLADLDDIAKRKRSSAKAQKAQQPLDYASGREAGLDNMSAEPLSGDAIDDVTDAAGEASWQGEPKRQAEAEQAAAVADMYAAAKAAGMESRQEADAAFSGLFGCQPAAATVEQLREQAATLRQIAGTTA